jgi:hypothetical protein
MQYPGQVIASRQSQTAKTLGLTILPEVLAIADELID